MGAGQGGQRNHGHDSGTRNDYQQNEQGSKVVRGRPRQDLTTSGQLHARTLLCAIFDAKGSLVVPNLSVAIDTPSRGAEVDLELANAAFRVVYTELDIVEDGLVLQTSWRLLPLLGFVDPRSEFEAA